MKAAIVDQYLDTLGGGERYTLSFAATLKELGYEVDIEWNNKEILKLAQNRFGIKLDNLNIKDDVKKGDGYDLIFWVSDGSIPLLHGRHNLIHFQVPFHNVDGKSLLNKMKLFRVDKIICNSHFTKEVVDKEYGVDSAIIYPPIDVQKIKPKRKENIICYIGRYSNLLQSKNQGMLIKAFEILNDPNWKLVIAGSNDIGENGQIEILKKMSEGKNIEILVNPDIKIIHDLIGKSKIFWSASGLGIDKDKFPEKLEHFGITVVEAMAGGAVPVIYNGGGHTEIVINGKDGLLWDTIDQMISITKSLIVDKIRMRELSENAVVKSKEFNYEKFRNSIKSFL